MTSLRAVGEKWHDDGVLCGVVLFAQQSAASEKVDLTAKSKVDSESKAVKSHFSRNSYVVFESKVDSESKVISGSKSTFDSNFLVTFDLRSVEPRDYQSTP